MIHSGSWSNINQLTGYNTCFAVKRAAPIRVLIVFSVRFLVFTHQFLIPLNSSSCVSNSLGNVYILHRMLYFSVLGD